MSGGLKEITYEKHLAFCLVHIWHLNKLNNDDDGNDMRHVGGNDQ